MASDKSQWLAIDVLDYTYSTHTFKIEEFCGCCVVLHYDVIQLMIV